MVGLVHAQAALAQAALLPILHLQHINPYVTGMPPSVDPAPVSK